MYAQTRFTQDKQKSLVSAFLTSTTATEAKLLASGLTAAIEIVTGIVEVHYVGGRTKMLLDLTLEMNRDRKDTKYRDVKGYDSLD